MKNASINVKNLIGDKCITIEQGLKLLEEIQFFLKRDYILAVDFSGVSIIASPFANKVAHSAINDFGQDVFKDSLFLSFDSEKQKDFFDRVIKTAIEYTTNRKLREAIDHVIYRYTYHHD